RRDSGRRPLIHQQAERLEHGEGANPIVDTDTATASAWIDALLVSVCVHSSVGRRLIKGELL
ncbi:MAG TPA: hypothetical protein VEZ12_20305, partial [Herpetosiphonaceae bacterium]|nr:hypothetical protein [Herpetosiphonaceae bacterium]